VLKFNPTSRLLISGSPDNTVRLIAIPEGLGDSCAYYPHIILYQIRLTLYSLSSASWSYALMMLFALFVILFAVALQLFIHGAI
jgi:prolactin regulatory element-binding protein